MSKGVVSERWPHEISALTRLFVAIPLPDEARDSLIAVQPLAIPGMRLIGRQELHLTLHFLGEVAFQDIGLVRRALAGMKTHSFAINISGVGRFPHEGQPQVLWAGVEKNSALFTLHRSIATALNEAVGFRPEERPYSPHVTLARLNAPVPPDDIARYLEEHRQFHLSGVLVRKFALYSSAVVDDVPQYQQEAIFPLTGHDE